MSYIDKTLYLRENELTNVDCSVLYAGLSGVKILSSLPAWFVNNTDVNGYSTSFNITPPYEGTYIYNVEVLVDEPPLQAATLTLVVSDEFYNVETCCTNGLNIVWFNRYGGYQNYTFSQRKDYGVNVNGDSTYINGDKLRYITRNRVYNRVTLYASNITQQEVDYLDSLRYSIQAWVFNDSDNSFTEIILNGGDFEKYNTKDNLYEVVISFRYSKQINIQDA